MQLTLYTFSKRHNSTARPTTGGVTVNVNLKRGTSILNPTFLLTGDIEEYLLYTYARWNDSYYFIGDMSIETTNLIQIPLSIDWLATYKSDIGNYTAFVERSASLYNPLLNDNSLSKTYDVINKLVQKGAEFPNVVPSGCFLIRTTGQTNVGSSIGITTYALYAKEVSEILNFLFTDSNFDFLSDTSVKSFFNPFQYIIDCQWFPFAPSYFGRETATFKLGWWDSGVTCFVVTEYSVGFSQLVGIPSGTYTDFRKYSAEYTSLAIYLPSAGLYLLNPAECSSANIAVTYTIDVATGNAQIILSDGDYILGTFAGQISSQVSIGQLTVELFEAAKGFAGGIGSIFSGNIGEGINSLINGTQTALQPTQSVNGNAGNIASILVRPVVEVYRIEYGSAQFPLAVYGRPLMQNVRLSTLAGYIKCGNASISTEAPEIGKTAINNFLNGGFYYE